MAAVICCLATVSLTAHAVFTYSAQTGEISIQMASFSVETQVQFAEAVTASTPSVATFALDVASEENGTLEEKNILEEDGSYKFPGHGTATFTLIPIGTAGEGYVVVTIEGKGTYYAGQISKDNNYIFSITAEEGTVVNIEGVWGKYSADSTNSTDSTANAEMQLIENAVIELITAEELSELTATPTPVPTVAPTISPSPEAIVTPTVSPEVTASPTPSEEPTVSPEITASPTPSAEPTVSPDITASPAPSEEPTASPEVTASPIPSEVPAVSPEATLEPTVEPTATPIV